MIVMSATIPLVQVPSPAWALSGARGPGISPSSQIAALSTQVMDGGARLHALAVTAAEAEQAAEQAASKVAQVHAEVATRTRELDHAKAALLAQALSQYTHSAPLGKVASLFTGNIETAGIANEYTSVVMGNETNAIVSFRRARVQLAETEASLAVASGAATKRWQDVLVQEQSLQGQIATEDSLLGQARRRLAAEMAAANAARQAAAARRAAAVLASAPQAVPVSVLVAPPGNQGSSLAEDMARLRQCESGDDYSLDTGNGYYGAYQFSAQTWSGLGYPGLPNQAPPPTQDQAALTLHSESGWSSWPACSAMLGLD